MTLAGFEPAIPAKRVAPDPRFRPRGHLDRHPTPVKINFTFSYINFNIILFLHIKIDLSTSRFFE
jgi:hypothetical protein